MGNVLGYIGHGPRLVAMDAHIDTVGIGNIKNWDFDPYEGMETDELIGRGTSDQEGGMASMVYAGKIIKDLGLEDEYTLLVTGTVQEEDCDGLCWQYIIEQSGIRPEFVVSTEPTDCQVYRGQRGRMEIRIDVQVLAATVRHQNVITPFSKWVQFLANYKNSPNVWVMTNSSAKAPSPFLKFSSLCCCRCAVADTAVSIDRRLTWGETLGRRAGRDPCPACGTKERGISVFHVQLRPSVLDWPGLSNRMLLPDLESGRRSLHR